MLSTQIRPPSARATASTRRPFHPPSCARRPRGFNKGSNTNGAAASGVSASQSYTMAFARPSFASSSGLPTSATRAGSTNRAVKQGPRPSTRRVRSVIASSFFATRPAMTAARVRWTAAPHVCVETPRFEMRPSERRRRPSFFQRMTRRAAPTIVSARRTDLASNNVDDRG